MKSTAFRAVAIDNASQFTMDGVSDSPTQAAAVSRDMIFSHISS
jgi:hypothetical protein